MASSSLNDSGTQSGSNGQAVADMSKYEKMLGNAVAQCRSGSAILKGGPCFDLFFFWRLVFFLVLSLGASSNFY